MWQPVLILLMIMSTMLIDDMDAEDDDHGRIDTLLIPFFRIADLIAVNDSWHILFSLHQLKPKRPSATVSASGRAQILRWWKLHRASCLDLLRSSEIP